MYIVGVDIAKRHHEAIVIDREGQIVQKPFRFANTAEGFRKFLSTLEPLNITPKDVTVAMESTSHYWIAFYSALMKHGFEPMVINPIQSDALRNLYIRQVKNDAHDSLVIAQVIRFGQEPEGTIQATEYYELRELCRGRAYIVDMCADLKKKVIALLDQVFPEYETLFSSIFGVTSKEVLINCSAPEDILAIPTENLIELIAKPSGNRFKRAKAEQMKQVAQNSFGVIVGVDSMKMLIRQHIEHIKFMESQIAEIETKIATLYETFDCHLTTIPGVGPTLAATILSEVGNIHRFPSAAKLAAFAGIDPTVKQSGEFNSSHNHMSKRGSPYLRRAIWQASVGAALNDPNMKRILQQKQAEGKPYMNAIGHITRKLTSIIFAVMRDNKPYYVRQ